MARVATTSTVFTTVKTRIFHDMEDVRDGRHLVKDGDTDKPSVICAPSPNCIADRCAMWRWKDKASEPLRIDCPEPAATTDYSSHDRELCSVPITWTFLPFRPYAGPAQWLQPEYEANAKRRGYCGLAPLHAN